MKTKCHERYTYTYNYTFNVKEWEGDFSFLMAKVNSDVPCFKTLRLPDTAHVDIAERELSGRRP